MRRSRTISALALSVGLAACDVGDIVVPVPPHVGASSASALSSVPPITVQVQELRQARGTGLLPGRIGERQAYAEVAMGQVTVQPPPGSIVGEALRAELRAAGLRVVNDDASATIGGDVQRFSIRTPATAVYWDVIGTVAVAVTATHGSRSATSQYTASCQERTAIWPTRELIARVLAACVDDIGRQFRDDPAIAQALSG